MPPKAKLGREEILQGATEFVKRNGFEALNARSLARELGISTTPIFSCFKGMGEVKAEVTRRATELYTSFIDEGLREEKGFKGVGRAYVRFAKAEPQLFRLLFMTSTEETRAMKPATDPNAPRVTAAAIEASGLEQNAAEKLYLELWIFVHGIAVASVTGTFEFSDGEIDDMLTDAFEGIRKRLREK